MANGREPVTVDPQFEITPDRDGWCSSVQTTAHRQDSSTGLDTCARRPPLHFHCAGAGVPGQPPTGLTTKWENLIIQYK